MAYARQFAQVATRGAMAEGCGQATRVRLPECVVLVMESVSPFCPKFAGLHVA